MAKERNTLRRPMKWHANTFGFLCLVAAACAAARELPSTPPEAAGMSGERLAAITTLSRKYVDEGKLPNVVAVVSRQGKVVHFSAVGKRGVDDPRLVRKDDLFRIYSMSKPITAVAAMVLYEQGAFHLQDPITKFLPEFENAVVQVEGSEATEPLENPITMQQLLSHTAGFSYGFGDDNPVDKALAERKIFEAKNLDEFVAKVAEVPLRYQPGKRWNYSLAVDLTGAIVERIAGQPFDQFLQEALFEPLDMRDTFFEVPAAKRDRFLPNHTWDAESQKLVDFVANGYPVYENTTFFSGGGGLVSTAMDYLKFAEMMRRGGELYGKRILSPMTVRFMTMNHLPGAVAAIGRGESPSETLGSGSYGFGFGLGFGVSMDPVRSGTIGSPGEYSWGGAAGTIFWIDPVEDIVVVAMTQLMGSPWPLRDRLKTLTYAALTDINEPL